MSTMYLIRTRDSRAGWAVPGWSIPPGLDRGKPQRHRLAGHP